jgi:pSer/pThr/pTyr-binding forkhead associated (FHA) protein
MPAFASSPGDSADQTAGGSSSPYDQDWSILLDDGRRIAVEGLVLLGRNPQPKAGEEDAQLIKIADETRTVSKSHLAVGVDAGGIYIVDRGSTNGSTVSTTNGMSSRCRAGEMVRVGDGAIVSIGDHWLEITRGN